MASPGAHGPRGVSRGGGLVTGAAGVGAGHRACDRGRRVASLGFFSINPTISLAGISITHQTSLKIALYSYKKLKRR